MEKVELTDTTLGSSKIKEEEVTDVKMRKFCFRKPKQHIIIVNLENKNGQSYELEIDEATARAIVKLFDEKRKKVDDS